MFDVKNTVNKLQKKYPNQEIRALQFNNSPLNITFMSKSYLGIVVIDSVPYNGVYATHVDQNYDTHTATITIIIDINDFMLSNVRGRTIIDEYGI